MRLVEKVSRYPLCRYSAALHDGHMNTYGTIPVNDTLGRYRVSFRIADTGFYRFLESSKVVTAPSRAEAVASVKGGTGAEVMEWGPGDPEPREAIA